MSTTTEEMAENQENPLSPAIVADQLQVQTFYNGVNPSTRQMIDAAAGGTINNKTPEAAYEFIEEMSLNNYQWQVMRTKPTKTASVYNVNAVNMLSKQVELLNKKIDGLLGSTHVHPVMRCDSSRGGIHTEYQPFNPTTEEEQVHYMGNQRPQNPPGFQQPPYQQEKKPNLEEMLSKFISLSETCFQNTETTLKNQQASIQGLETQIGQLSKLIFERPPGSLPSNTEPNSREQLNAINVRNEKGLVVSEPEPKQETVVSKGKGETPNAMKFLKELLANKWKLDEPLHVELNAVCSAILQNKLPNKLKDPGSFTIPCLIGRPFLATARTIIDVGTSELTLRVGDETITLQARNSSNTSKVKGGCINYSTKTDHMVQPILQEMSSNDIHEPCSINNKGPIHEKRRLQIEELDEWQTHKLRTHDKPKLRQDELNTSPNQLKVGDKVLLDAANPRIPTAKPNKEISLMVLCIFLFVTV
ncbi:hypothetical protein CXB51_008564 [Gossypium anomalum]|uniref:Uncharacterized protein n=1 Tax=Gossypium anomalum TaxID=47600 RepID=A0A8J5YX63_9ROSI|nr:hypothetical protein CXB51_008564 [Gossypium anomalum]